MQALALLLEVLRHRRIVPSGREQLDVRLGDLEQRLFDPVGLDDLAVIDDRAERLPVVVDRGAETAHRDGHMVDLGEHRRNVGRGLGDRRLVMGIASGQRHTKHLMRDVSGTT